MSEPTGPKAPASRPVPPTPATSPPAPQSFWGRERRRDLRRPMQSRATLTILDGPGAGASHDVTTRDLSLSGVAFLLKNPLDLGQACRLDMPGQSGGVCQVVRCRPLSVGKYEIGIQYRCKS